MQTEAGAVPATPGWFVLNARDARWGYTPGMGHGLPLIGIDEDEAEALSDAWDGDPGHEPEGAEHDLPLGG